MHFFSPVEGTLLGSAWIQSVMPVSFKHMSSVISKCLVIKHDFFHNPLEQKSKFQTNAAKILWIIQQNPLKNQRPHSFIGWVSAVLQSHKKPVSVFFLNSQFVKFGLKNLRRLQFKCNISKVTQCSEDKNNLTKQPGERKIIGTSNNEMDEPRNLLSSLLGKTFHIYFLSVAIFSWVFCS